MCCIFFTKLVWFAVSLNFKQKFKQNRVVQTTGQCEHFDKNRGFLYVFGQHILEGVSVAETTVE